MNGPDTAPVYKFLKAQKSGSLGSRRIKWNFTKFLVDEEGRVIQRYSPTTQPLAIEVLSLSLSPPQIAYMFLPLRCEITNSQDVCCFVIFDRMTSRRH